MSSSSLGVYHQGSPPRILHTPRSYLSHVPLRCNLYLLKMLQLADALTRASKSTYTQKLSEEKRSALPYYRSEMTDRTGLRLKRPAISVPNQWAILHWIRRFANVNNVKILLRYRINSSCKLFLSMYTFTVLTMRLSVSKLNESCAV